MSVKCLCELLSMFTLIEQCPSIKRHSLSTGLSKTAVLVRTLTCPTKPLPSRKVSTILPSSQEFFAKIQSRQGQHPQLPNSSEGLPTFVYRLGGKVTSDLRNNRWFGVRGSILFGSLDTGVMGRLFMMFSTSHIKVTRRWSSAICS